MKGRTLSASSSRPAKLPNDSTHLVSVANHSSICEPQGMSRRELKLPPPVLLGDKLLDLRGFVGGITVQHKMQLPVLRQPSSLSENFLAELKYVMI